MADENDEGVERERTAIAQYNFLVTGESDCRGPYVLAECLSVYPGRVSVGTVQHYTVNGIPHAIQFIRQKHKDYLEHCDKCEISVMSSLNPGDSRLERKGTRVLSDDDMRRLKEGVADLLE